MRRHDVSVPAVTGRLLTPVVRSWWGPAVQCGVTAVAGVALIAAPFMYHVLPPRFTMDAQYLEGLVNTGASGYNSNSFNTVAAIYRSVGLTHMPALVGLIGVGVFIIALVMATPFADIARYGIAATFTYGAAIVCALAYLAQYSKEFFTLLLVVFLLIAPARKSSECVFVIAALLYAVLVRPYWFIVVGGYLFWRARLFRTRHWWVHLVYAFMFFCLLEAAFQLVMNGSLSDLRADVNTYRAGLEVDTMISPPIPMHGLLAGPGGMVMLLSLMVPVPLFLDGGIVHMVAAVFITLLWACVLAAAVQIRRRLSYGIAVTRRDHVLMRVIPLLFAFVLTQAVFEPDYGSYLKHLTPLLPAFLALMPLRAPAARSVGTPRD